MTRRCNIGFVLMSEHSSYNAALGLARAVQERGHDAIFFASAATVFPGLVSAQGFRVAVTPPGHEPHVAARDKPARYRLWKRLRRRAEGIRREQEFLVDSIRTNALDLCFLDAVRYDLYPFALALARAGVPTVLLSYTFASRCATDYPPVFASAIPSRATRPGAGERAHHALRWAWALATRGHGRAFGRGEYLQLVAGKWLEHARNASFEHALRRLGRRSAWSEWKRRPRLPEIVFGHRALDWLALTSDPDRYYFGTTDLFRGTPDFDWSGIDSGKPIVYCNLSTINGFENIDASSAGRGGSGADLSAPRFRMARRYLDAVLGCFAQRTDWQLLLACGPFHAALKHEVRSPNIHVYERLPQLAVLPRADLAIGWGGAGTVRECVNHRVPMVILPAWTDQFGNAARVVARNLGARADIFDVTAQQLVAIVERVLADRTIRAAMADVARQCDADAEIAGLLRFVERHTGLRL